MSASVAAATGRRLDIRSSQTKQGNPKPPELEHHRRTGGCSPNLAGAILTSAEVNFQLPAAHDEAGRSVGGLTLRQGRETEEGGSVKSV